MRISRYEDTYVILLRISAPAEEGAFEAIRAAVAVLLSISADAASCCPSSMLKE